MKSIGLYLALVFLAVPAPLIADEGSSAPKAPPSSILAASDPAVTLSRPIRTDFAPRPFTLGGSMESISSLGAQFQVASNLNRHMNLRGAYGWLFLKKWVSSGDYTTHGSVNLGSTNVVLDFYPFPKRGLRFSSGVLVHNSQVAEGLIPMVKPQGGAFMVNGNTYYSASADVKYDPALPAEDQGPVYAHEAVQVRKQGITITTGWGNMASGHRSGHWSFPVEIGVALLGSPAMKLNSVFGQICDAAGQNCTAASKNGQLQRDIQAQFGSYKSHLDILKTYPLFSCGIAYRFRIRNGIRD